MGGVGSAGTGSGEDVGLVDEEEETGGGSRSSSGNAQSIWDK